MDGSSCEWGGSGVGGKAPDSSHNTHLVAMPKDTRTGAIEMTPTSVRMCFGALKASPQLLNSMGPPPTTKPAKLCGARPGETPTAATMRQQPASLLPQSKPPKGAGSVCTSTLVEPHVYTQCATGHSCHCGDRHYDAAHQRHHRATDVPQKQ